MLFIWENATQEYYCCIESYFSKFYTWCVFSEDSKIICQNV